MQEAGARFFVALLLLNLFFVSQDCLAESQPLHTKIDRIKAMPLKQTKSSLAIEAKAFEQVVLDIKDALSKIKGDVENKPISIQSIVSTIEGKRLQIKAIDLEIKAALEQEEIELKEKGYSSTILRRHEEFAEKYKTNVAALITCLDEVCASDESKVCSSIQKTLDFIDNELLPKEPCLSSPLPEDVKKPEFSREEMLDVKGIIKKDEETPPVFSPPAETTSSEKQSMYAPPLTTQTKYAPLPPAEYDLDPTRDIHFTQEIIDLAASLDHDPVKIFEWVSNNIDYIPYYGSYKGSQYTLLERSGNDWDTCSMLMALYRVSGIPCRYRRGIIRMQSNTVKNWVGVQDVDTAWSIFWRSYVPVGPIWGDTACTRLAGLVFEHVFVEAYLPYGNYRGHMNDLSEKMWIPLDPSFKSYDYTEGNGQAKEVAFDSQSYLAGTTTLSPIQYFKQQLQDQGISVQEAKRTRKIKEQKFEVLPSALPYYGQDDPYYKLDSCIGSSLSRLTINHRVRIELSTDRTYMIQQITDVPSLYGKRLAITYKGYCQEDEQLISEGKIHLAKLTPDLRVDGLSITNGWFGLKIGETEELKLFSIPPEPGYRKDGIGYPDDVGESLYLGYPYTLYTGAVHNLALDTAGDTSRLIKSRVDRFISTIENPPSEGINILSEEVMGELLCIAALKYLQNTETEINELASLKDYSINRRIWSAMTIQKVNPVALAGQPTYLELTTNLINAVIPDDYADVLYSIDGKTGGNGEITRLSLMNASFHEHKIWEEVVGLEAISTIKALQYAKATNISIHTITWNNQSEIDQLNLDSRHKQRLRELLNPEKHPGYRIIIPHSKFTYHDWTGIGYVWEHIEDGYGGYFIEGEMRGGETVVKDDPLAKMDAKWNGLDGKQRGKIVKNVNSFNNFTKSFAQVSDFKLRKIIAEQGVNYPDVDQDLMNFMVTLESAGNNPYAMNVNEDGGSDGGLGLGQFMPDTATWRMPGIKVNDELPQDFMVLQLSPLDSMLSPRYFADFKYNKLAADERTNTETGVKLMFNYIKWLMKRPWIGNDVAKIVAGYNAGAGGPKERNGVWGAIEKAKEDPGEYRKNKQISNDTPLWPYYLPLPKVTVKYINEMLRAKGLKEYEKYPLEDKKKVDEEKDKEDEPNDENKQNEEGQ